MVTVTLNMHDYSCAWITLNITQKQWISSWENVREWGLKWISGSYDYIIIFIWYINYKLYFSWLEIGVNISGCYSLLNNCESSHVSSNIVMLNTKTDLRFDKWKCENYMVND